MKVRPGPVLIGLAISAVVFAGAAFYSPVAAKAIPLVCVAAVVLAVYDGLWLNRHGGDLSDVANQPCVRQTGAEWTNVSISRRRLIM